MRFRECYFPVIEKKLCNWVLHERGEARKVSTTSIKMRELAQSKNIKDFKAFPS